MDVYASMPTCPPMEAPEAFLVEGLDADAVCRRVLARLDVPR